MYINKQLKTLIQEASEKQDNVVEISFKETTYFVVKEDCVEAQNRISEGNSVLQRFEDLKVLLCRK